MSVSNTNTYEEYVGDGSTTVLPITFEIIDNNQVKVKRYEDDTEEVLIEGADYTISGGTPGTSVVMLSAPTADQTIRVYRDTEQVQNTDYIETVGADVTEEQFDLIVMMIQELSTRITEVGSGGTGASAAPTEIAEQSVSNAEQITLGSSDQKLIKRLTGGTGGTTTTLIDDGEAAWQECRLVGQSDANPITIQSNTNLVLNGDVTLGADSVLDLVWDLENTKWIETGRSE